MGKKSKSRSGQQGESNADTKRLRRALRSLDLVDSRLDQTDWASRVARYVGDQIVDEWIATGAQDYTASYDFSYQSFDHAMHFSVGWRSFPLAAECEWMIPRLRDAISRSGHQAPFLVEIGSGPGAAAALISAALKVPVVAIDSHPKFVGLPEQFALRTGGEVESRLGEAFNLLELLDGAKPAAVFGLGIYAHMQPRRHSSDSFSYWADMQHILATHLVEPQVESFIDALAGADLLLAEKASPEHVAEMASGLFMAGYEIPKGGLTRIHGATPDGPTVVNGMHFTKADLPKRDPNLLIEMYEPFPTAVAFTESSSDDDAFAEAMRFHLEPTEFVKASENVYTDGSGRLRHEVSVRNHLVVHYRSTTRGFRHMKFFERDMLTDVLNQISENEEALLRNGTITVHQCSLPAVNWGRGFAS